MQHEAQHAPARPPRHAHRSAAGPVRPAVGKNPPSMAASFVALFGLPLVITPHECHCPSLAHSRVPSHAPHTHTTHVRSQPCTLKAIAAPLATVQCAVLEPIDAVREPRGEEHLLVCGRGFCGWGAAATARVAPPPPSPGLSASRSAPAAPVGHTVRPSTNCLSLAPSVTIMAAGRGLTRKLHRLPDATRPGTRTCRGQGLGLGRGGLLGSVYGGASRGVSGGSGSGCRNGAHVVDARPLRDGVHVRHLAAALPVRDGPPVKLHPQLEPAWLAELQRSLRVHHELAVQLPHLVRARARARISASVTQGQGQGQGQHQAQGQGAGAGPGGGAAALTDGSGRVRKWSSVRKDEPPDMLRCCCDATAEACSRSISAASSTVRRRRRRRRWRAEEQAEAGAWQPSIQPFTRRQPPAPRRRRPAVGGPGAAATAPCSMLSAILRPSGEQLQDRGGKLLIGEPRRKLRCDSLR